MSACLFLGFFALAGGRRVSVPKPGSSSSTFFCFYASTIQCMDGSAFPAELRIYSPPGDSPLPDDTIAFAVCKGHAPPAGTFLLDAISFYPVPGDPSHEAYEESVPDMQFPLVSLLGTVPTPAENASGTRTFSVRVQERVRDVAKESSFLCVIPGDSPRWTNVPSPSANSLVYVLGRCGQTWTNGSIAIHVEHLVINLAPPPPSPSSPTAGAKRKKFNAVVIPSPASQSSVSASITGSQGDGHVPSSPTLGERSPSPVPSTSNSASQLPAAPAPPASIASTSKTSRAHAKQRASS